MAASRTFSTISSHAKIFAGLVTSTVAVAGTGVGLSVYYANQVGNICTDALAPVVDFFTANSPNLIEKIVNQALTIPSYKFDLASISGIVKYILLGQEETLAQFGLKLPLSTPSLTFKLAYFINQQIIDTLQNILDQATTKVVTIDDIIHDICKYATLNESLQWVALLTIALSLTTVGYRIHSKQSAKTDKMEKNIESLKEQVSELNRRLISDLHQRPTHPNHQPRHRGAINSGSVTIDIELPNMASSDSSYNRVGAAPNQ